MARIIRLTENDLTRLVKRIIREQKGGTHSPMAHLADVLIPFGFVKLNNASTKLGDNGVFNGLSKGYDENGASIYYSSRDNLIQLLVTIDSHVIINKKYKMIPPDYKVDHEQILEDLGSYKTRNFKKPPYRG